MKNWNTFQIERNEYKYMQQYYLGVIYIGPLSTLLLTLKPPATSTYLAHQYELNRTIGNHETFYRPFCTNFLCQQ